MINKIIIIADRKQAYIDSTQQVLEEYGYHTIIAYDGASGLNLTRKEKPDLVLIEAALPGFSGFQICSLLKLDIKYKDIRIIIISDIEDSKGKLLARSSRADGYLKKPIDINLLIKNIKQLTN